MVRILSEGNHHWKTTVRLVPAANHFKLHSSVHPSSQTFGLGELIHQQLYLLLVVLLVLLPLDLLLAVVVQHGVHSLVDCV